MPLNVYNSILSIVVPDVSVELDFSTFLFISLHISFLWHISFLRTCTALRLSVPSGFRLVDSSVSRLPDATEGYVCVTRVFPAIFAISLKLYTLSVL